MNKGPDEQTKKPKLVASDTREWKSGMVRFAVIAIPGHPEKNYVKFEKDLLGVHGESQRFNLRIHDWNNLKRLIEDELPEKHKWLLDESGLKLIEDRELVEKIENLAERNPEVLEKVLNLPNLGNLSDASFEAIDRLALRIYEIQAENVEKVLRKLSRAEPTEFEQFAAMLDNLQLGQVSMLANLLHQKLKIIALFEKLSTSKITREREIHKLIENNPWIAHKRYEVSSSDKPLKTYLDDNVPMDPELKKRPDLIVKRLPYQQDIALIELKAPDVKLEPAHIGQIIKYRSLIEKYKPGTGNIDCYLFGYEIHPSYAPLRSNDVTIKTYAELIDDLKSEYADYLKVLEEAKQPEELEEIDLGDDIPF